MIQPQKRIYRNDVSQQTREKQSIAHQGRKHSNDTKQKISKAMCDYWAKLPMKPINNNDTSTTDTYGYEQDKAERLKEWLGWDTIDKLYRVEVVLHNINVREFVERYGERLYSECGEHPNVLNPLGMSDFRLGYITNIPERV